MKCETANCPDHFGKFLDCLAEAIYEMALDRYEHGYEEDTGSTDFEGHYTRMYYSEDYEFELDPEPKRRAVTIPAGHYIVEVMSGGAVWLLGPFDKETSQQYFDKVRRAYENWRGTEDW